MTFRAEINSATPQERLLFMLRGEFQPLYVLLDAAIEPDVLKILYESKEERQSLYEGVKGAQLAHFAPYLVRLPRESSLLEVLVHRGWGKSWGVYLTCDKSLDELRTHFRHFLLVTAPDGKQLYFRFYDPRVLRIYLPSCLPEEINHFFGRVRHYVMEDENPNLWLRFSNTANEGRRKVLHIAVTFP